MLCIVTYAAGMYYNLSTGTISSELQIFNLDTLYPDMLCLREQGLEDPW